MKVLIPMVLAAALGVGAIMIGQRLLEDRPDALPVEVTATTRVVVAGDDKHAGSMLSPEDLRLVSYPTEGLPAGVFRSPEGLAGRVLSTQVVAGQMLLETMLAPEGTGPGLQARIPEGMRAVSLQVNEQTSVAGLLLPGSRVDVIGTYLDEVSQELVSKTVVENVEVSAVGQRIVVPAGHGEKQGEVTRSVTLLVTPRQAEKLEMAEYKGRPRLALRGGQDHMPVDSIGVSYAELLDRPNWMMPQQAASTTEPEVEPIVVAAAPAPEPIVRRSVEIIRGGRTSETSFRLREGPNGMMQVERMEVEQDVPVPADGSLEASAPSATEGEI